MQRVRASSFGPFGFGVRYEKLFKQLGRAGDRWDTDPRLGPGHLAAAVDPAFGSDGQRREPRLSADLVGNELIDRDVAIGTEL